VKEKVMADEQTPAADTADAAPKKAKQKSTTTAPETAEDPSVVHESAAGGGEYVSLGAGLLKRVG
jgi:hypothetical protein